MALTEEQFRGFLRLNFQAKEDFDTEIPHGNNPGGRKCCDFYTSDLCLFIICISERAGVKFILIGLFLNPRAHWTI